EQISKNQYRVYGRDYNTIHLCTEQEAQEIVATLEAEWLQELKKLKIGDLNENINAVYKAYLEKYPDVEIRTFEEKAKESFLVKKDPNTPCVDTPLLCRLTPNGTIEERNILAGQVFEKVVENAALEKWGVQTRDAIKAAENEEALNQISIEIPNLGV
ncbi:hypothetical protein, partial [Campylobacter sp. RM16191]|uniref:hypothetical protein n=1 Tax=Campylobacter sp. RM16191 TaxID=1705728 RepID=UPI0014752D54